MIDTILFDLDGTLLPIGQEEFIKAYFKELAAKIVPMGYDKDELVKGIWQGTAAMQKNDGSALNYDRFWQTFASVMGECARALNKDIDEFYVNEFNRVKACVQKEEDRGELIKDLKSRGFMLVLASNPVFPLCAFKTRLSWVGIDPDDFDYITHYENSSYCKPSAGYYREIINNIGKKPEQCLMIGNNPVEDGSITAIGAKAFIVTDILEGENISYELPSGTLEQAVEYALSIK